MTLFRSAIWRDALGFAVLRSPATGSRALGACLRLAATAWLFVFAAVVVFAPTAPAGQESPRLGSIHGTLTTSQGDASDGLAGINVQLAANPPDGTPLSTSTDD